MLKQLRKMPPGCGTIFFVQLFSTIGYAILYSSLVLYMMGKLGFEPTRANSTMGGFIAFYYSLHLLGGYLGGSWLSFRSLFTIGIVQQFLGCALLAIVGDDFFYWGMALFLIGAGLNVTSLNMMLTQKLQDQHEVRESVFLLNYSGMNLGAFIGFGLAGYLYIGANYQLLFSCACIGYVLSLLISFSAWAKLQDHETNFSQLPKSTQWFRCILTSSALIGMTPGVKWLLLHLDVSNSLIVAASASMAFLILKWAFSEETTAAKNKLLAFLLLSLSAVLFWALYQLAPMGLTVFANYNVDREVFGFLISPQWIQNINTLVIFVGGPLMIPFLQAMRDRGVRFTVPMQFSSALVCIGLGFLALPVGIFFADANGMVAFHWVATSYVLQSIGELLISPLGYAMIGKLVPVRLQSILMGTWMMLSGVAGVISGYFSNLAIAATTTTDPLVTNSGYQATFVVLGGVAMLLGFLIFAGINRLNWLTGESHI